MATNLQIAAASAQIGWTFTKDDAIGGQTSNSSTVVSRIANALTNGAGAGQANTLYVANRTLAGAASDSLDLAGSLTDVFGGTITFTAVKGILIVHNSSYGGTTYTASSITVGAGATPFINWVADATDAIKIRNGYTFALFGADAAGYAVTAATGDILKILNNDGTNSANYSIVLYGI